MNQINLGAKAGIDTKEVQYWEMREVAGLQSTHVDFKNGITVILRGEAKAAFDEWAATLPRAGMRAGERQEGEQDDDVHGWTPPPEARRLCTTCRWHDPAVNGCRYPRRPKPEKPECYGVEEVLKANKPLCETCACYEAESGHCTEFAGNHYPECWVEAKGKEPPCELCERSPDGGETRARVYDEEFPACFVERKEAPGPPEKAKVLLLSRIWECNKCGEVLAIDITTGEPADVSQDEVHIDGEVKIRIDGVPLVRCPNCQIVNEWPAELRERVAKGTAEEGADDRTG